MYYIGVDLGGTNIAVGIVNSKLEIVDKGSVPTNANRAAELIVKDMAALSESLLKKNGIALSDVAYVGIAAPSRISILQRSSKSTFLSKTFTLQTTPMQLLLQKPWQALPRELEIP